MKAVVPTHIILHHSLTEDSGTVSWGAIRRYHVEVKGWRDIAYHFGVELVGDHHEVLLGRWWDEAGAHVAELGMNQKSLGICLVGNFDALSPPQVVWDVALRLVQRLVTRWGIPVANVLGHREVGLLAGLDWQVGAYKTCPGRLFDLEAFRWGLA